MSVLVDKHSRILIQGITGTTGRTYAERMVANGTPLVGGVTPGKGGQTVAGVPVFDTMTEAVAETRADSVLSAIGAPRALDGIYEAFDAGISLVVLYTENVPIHDAVKMRAYALAKGGRLFGPNSAGIISPGQANMADLSDDRVRPGRIGVLSKSGTLTYEVLDDMELHGFGASSVVCLGGDPVIGTLFVDVLPLFEADTETDAVVLLGEPGGTTEYRALEYVQTMSKPVIAHMTGQSAPAEKRMGHAGAISGESGQSTTAAAKLEAFGAAGCETAALVTEIGSAVGRALERIQP